MPDSYSTTTTRTELVTETDPTALARPVADVIRDECAAGIRAITEMAKDGKHRLFNKTGHLSNGLTVEAQGAGGTFAIVAPSDRFDDDKADVQMARLVGLVPVIADPLASERVRTAIEESWARLVGKR